MIELRWRDAGTGDLSFACRMESASGSSHLATLEFRERGVQVDASGAFCGFGEWSDWRPVPTYIEPEGE